MLTNVRRFECQGNMYKDSHVTNAYVCCPDGRSPVVYKPAAVIVCCNYGVGTSPWTRGCNSGGSVYPL